MTGRAWRVPRAPGGGGVALPARARRAAQSGAAAVGVGLLVIAGALAVSLPRTVAAAHWAVAWVGLDLAIAVVALLGHRLLRRGDPRAALSAMGVAALLVVDAWFDVCLSSGRDLVIAVVEAAAVELPLAATAVWLACRLLPNPPGRRTGGNAVILPGDKAPWTPTWLPTGGETS